MNTDDLLTELLATRGELAGAMARVDRAIERIKGNPMAAAPANGNADPKWMKLGDFARRARCVLDVERIRQLAGAWAKNYLDGFEANLWRKAS